MARALVVDDDRNTLSALADLVELQGFSVERADTLAKARGLLQAERPDVVLCDLILPDGHGTDLLRDLEGVQSTELILITANASVETAVEALRLGAYDYLTKPVDIPRLRSLLGQLRRTQGLKQEVSHLRQELRHLGRFGALVGTSPAMQAVYDLIERVAPREATVLITGDSGTGKEIVAQTVHELSRRRQGSFLPLNCGAISPTLIESELFGHERGSFTGADRQHKGYFERASAGTLFLDEVTEMPLELQVKLLRVLETGKISRIGGDKEIPVEARVLAASNRNLDNAVKEGKLREDLYYRLNVFPIALPPLRDRDGDVTLLALHFLALHNAAEGTEKEFTPTAMERLIAHRWPGNVREVKNVVERAFILADEEIGAECLPPEIAQLDVAATAPVTAAGGADATARDGAATGPLVQVRVGSPLADVERRLILATLGLFGGDKRRAAEALGVSLKTLYNRLREYHAGRGEKSDPEPPAAEPD